jgi:hypothetical protein
VLVPVQIDGHDVWMALSMATGLPSMSTPAVNLLGLKTSHFNSADLDLSVNGTPIKEKVTPDHLIIGLADFTGWTIYVTPDSGRGVNQFHGKPVVGTLTSRFMQVVDVELNLGKNKMNLFTQTSCKTEPVYWDAEFTTVRLFRDGTGLMVFPMELDGKLIETSLNTGSRYSRINSAVTNNYFGFNEKSEGIEREITTDGREVLSYRAMGLSAKGLEVNHAKVQLLKGTRNCNPTTHRETQAIAYGTCMNATPFSIGTDLLRELRIYIASKQEKIYFTRADPAAQ